jgi:SAM-dependent methyltransferase
MPMAATGKDLEADRRSPSFAGDRFPWRQYRRLLWNEATLSRVLSEIELESLCDMKMSGVERRVLVAGGGRTVGGSDRVALTRRLAELPTVFADVLPSRTPDIVANLTEPWPFRDDAFDVVLSTWVVEHLPDPTTYFHETFRVLRSPGLYLCAVPFLYRQHGSPQDFVRFTDDALVHLASVAGFRHILVHRVGGTPLVCCVNLLWPILGLPGLGLSAFAVATVADKALVVISRLAGRRGEVLQSYPMAHVLAAEKRG